SHCSITGTQLLDLYLSMGSCERLCSLPDFFSNFWVIGKNLNRIAIAALAYHEIRHAPRLRMEGIVGMRALSELGMTCEHTMEIGTVHFSLSGKRDRGPHRAYGLVGTSLEHTLFDRCCVKLSARFVQARKHSLLALEFSTMGGRSHLRRCRGSRCATGQENGERADGAAGQTQSQWSNRELIFHTGILTKL